MGGVVYDAQGEKHDARKVLLVPAASMGVASRGSRRREAMRPFKEFLVQLIKERGGLQLSGAARHLGRDPGFKHAMGAQRRRLPTFLELLTTSSQAGGVSRSS